MSTTSDSALSLVERKKLQWAREKEELAALNSSWSADQNCRPFDRNPRQTKRRSSLPPLYKNQYNSYDREKEIGGETSGYGSDNPNQSPDYVQTWNNNNQSGYESSSSRDDRMKWGDKAFEKSDLHEPPNWVKRGLKGGEIIVNNTSPAESPEQRYEEDRPQTGSSYSQNRYTYLRGQNIPIDSVEMAERERRRQLAIAHQEAIRLQLEEREKRRKEEKERRIKEEYEEELRIEREQEMERKRKEQELQILQEKQERDRKRKEAIQEAIELAQKEAQLVKMRKNKNHFINTDVDEKNSEPKGKFAELPNVDKNPEVATFDNKEKKSNSEQLNNTKILPPRSDSVNNDINNNLEIRGKSISPRQIKDTENNAKIVSPRNNTIENQTATPSTSFTNLLSTPRIENNLALVIPAPIENLQNLQYALLIPTTPQNVKFPPAEVITRTENRILTPTQFRDRNKKFCDSSTQTDESVFVRTESSCDNREKVTREKLTNLDLSYDNRNRKERRSRSESLEERPKWGVNRPPTRYIKQSEKDPLYQRRKLRQKQRESKTYDDKNSSDESQTASPRSYRKKGCMDKRHSRSQWKKDEVYTRNIRMYQTEIIPLESDKDHIYYKRSDCCCFCRCGRHRCSDGSLKVDILKIDHHSPRDAHMERTDKLPEIDVNEDMLDKLSSLHNGLLMKQEQWDSMRMSSPAASTSWQ
ncbi:trichohyalin-like [Diabrotica virgifera virgifera]|uniref:Trichohyalin-like n=1 Tax=Diabrotica virgifera virgifera TaxID=50390 RepID=A0A6P7FSV2_DIAVI|nr:trichohyalin-like [Diabrotica virgifera virgifera]